MKKIYTIAIVSFLVLISLGISIYQYVATTKADLANAASTKPANGHSWAEMEADSDSIQVNGQKITNLALPTSDADAATKAYVDAAGSGGTYSACYVLYSATSGVSCAAGYTSIAHNFGNSAGWVVDTADGATNPYAFLLTVGGSLVTASFSYCHYSHGMTDCLNYLGGSNAGGLACSSGSWSCAATNPAISFGNNNLVRTSPTVLASAAFTFGLCCK